MWGTATSRRRDDRNKRKAGLRRLKERDHLVDIQEVGIQEVMSELNRIMLEIQRLRSERDELPHRLKETQETAAAIMTNLQKAFLEAWAEARGAVLSLFTQ